MYKELRDQGSTPSVWADNFLTGRTKLPVLRESFLRNDLRWKEMQKRLAPGASVLDAGSGLGDWVRFLHARGYKAQGVDYSEAMCARLRAEAPEVPWTVADIRAIPVPDASLDAVISWGVMRHEEEGPDAALREFHRIVRPGGLIFVTVPLDTFEHRYASMVMTHDPSPGGTFFQYMFKHQEFADVVARAGFDMKFVASCSRHPAVLAPNVCQALERAPSLVYRVGFDLLAAVARKTARADNMVLAIGRRR